MENGIIDSIRGKDARDGHKMDKHTMLLDVLSLFLTNVVGYDINAKFTNLD